MIWTIANDDLDRLRDFQESEGIELPILIDADAEVIQRYAIANEASDRDIPHPTALLIDRSGTVRYQRIDEDYRVRPPVEELIKAIASIE